MNFGFIVLLNLFKIWLRKMHALTGSNEENPQFKTQSYLCRSSESKIVSYISGMTRLQKKSGCDAAYSSKVRACDASRGVAGIHSASAESPRNRECHARLALGLPNCRYRWYVSSCSTLHSQNVISSSERPPTPGKLICGSSGRSGISFFNLLEVHLDFANPFAEPHPMRIDFLSNLASLK